MEKKNIKLVQKKKKKDIYMQSCRHLQIKVTLKKKE